jgi:hypothetical protein
MTLEDMKQEWGAQQDAELVRLSPEEILLHVKAESRRLERQVRFRDWREIVAAAAALVIIVPGAIHANLVTRIGTVALVAAFALMGFALFRARRVAGPGSMEMSVAEVLRHERSRVEAQVRLLEGVMRWYLGPIFIALVTIVAGRAGLSVFTDGFAAGMAILSLVIYRLNRTAARTYLRPRLDELSHLLAEMGETGHRDT